MYSRCAVVAARLRRKGFLDRPHSVGMASTVEVVGRKQKGGVCGWQWLVDSQLALGFRASGSVNSRGWGRRRPGFGVTRVARALR